MLSPEQLRVCESMVQKFTAGEKLTASEREHLACQECVHEIVLRLNQATEEKKRTGHTSDSGNDFVSPSPEIAQALKEGRRIFAREFGSI